MKYIHGHAGWKAKLQTRIPSWSFAGRRHRIVLQDDFTFRDDSVVPSGRVAAAGPFAGRDRRRFRSAQCDARFRIQPCPRPVSEYHVPPALPDSAGIPAGTSSLKRPAGESRRKKPRRNFWWRGCQLFQKWRKRKRASFSVHIILKSSFSTNFPRAIRAFVDETRICPTRYDATRYSCIFNIAKYNRNSKIAPRRELLRPWCSSDLIANSLVLLGRF